MLYRVTAAKIIVLLKVTARQNGQSTLMAKTLSKNNQYAKRISTVTPSCNSDIKLFGKRVPNMAATATVSRTEYAIMPMNEFGKPSSDDSGVFITVAQFKNALSEHGSCVCGFAKSCNFSIDNISEQTNPTVAKTATTPKIQCSFRTRSRLNMLNTML